MTLDFTKEPKPRIFKSDPKVTKRVWTCHGLDIEGFGNTREEAYANWQKGVKEISRLVDILLMTSIIQSVKSNNLSSSIPITGTTTIQ